MINKVDHFFGKIFNNLHFWGGSFLDKVMNIISYIAEAGILFLIIGLVLALFKKTRKMGGCILLSVAIGFLIANIILKPLVGRARPFSNIGSDFYKWWLEAGAIHESGYSFPSGHTTAATAFAIAIFSTTNKKHFWWILFLPILMACSRIYLMVHYFTDCIGGLIIGTASAILAYWIIKWIYSSKLKALIWVRELDLFSTHQFKNKTRSTQISNHKQTESNTSNNEYVYKMQNEESSQQTVDQQTNNSDKHE